MTSIRWFALVATVSTALALAGCTESSAGSPLPDDTASTENGPTSTEPATSSEPTTDRPREISLDDKDPCELIPQSDWPQFNIEQPGRVRENPNFNSPQCYYPGSVTGFDITLVVTEGVDSWNERDVDLANAAPIEGFPTITMANNVDERACYAAVDTADGQYLLTSATPDPNDPDQPKKCDLAYEVAESAMKTLVAS